MSRNTPSEWGAGMISWRAITLLARDQNCLAKASMHRNNSLREMRAQHFKDNGMKLWANSVFFLLHRERCTPHWNYLFRHSPNRERGKCRRKIARNRAAVGLVGVTVAEYASNRTVLAVFGRCSRRRVCTSKQVETNVITKGGKAGGLLRWDPWC